MTKNVTYYAIKVRDRYLTKIGCYLTEDLGQARLYRNLDNWERKSLEIIEKLKKNYGDYIYEELMIVLIEVKEMRDNVEALD